MIAWCSIEITGLVVIIDSINEQGCALRLHFEAVVAAVELPVPRGKLKSRIKTSWGGALFAEAPMIPAQSSLNRAVCCLRK